MNSLWGCEKIFDVWVFLIVAATGFGLIRGARSTTTCWHAGWPHSRSWESNTFYMLGDEEKSQSQLFRDLLESHCCYLQHCGLVFNSSSKLENSGYYSWNEKRRQNCFTYWLKVTGHIIHPLFLSLTSGLMLQFCICSLQPRDSALGVTPPLQKLALFFIFQHPSTVYWPVNETLSLDGRDRAV